MGSDNWLEVYKGLVEDAFRGKTLDTRQHKAADILSTAQRTLSLVDFKKLETFVFEKLEK